MPDDAAPNCYLLPVGDEQYPGVQAFQIAQAWLPDGRWWLPGDAEHRGALQRGDHCCFHVPAIGIVASADVAAPADQPLPRNAWIGPTAWRPGCYALPLQTIHWLARPTKLTTALRAGLDLFGRSDAPHARLDHPPLIRLTRRDYGRLTGR